MQMTRQRLVCALSGIFILSASGLILSRADDSLPDEGQIPVADAECSALGARRSAAASQHYLTVTTGQVTRAITAVAPVSRTKSFDPSKPLGTIDSYLIADMQAQGVQPADLTTDWEFIRRVT